MTCMKYKTRGMTTSQGKPRVYFSAHPKDQVRYFQEISDSILACVNCAVWYTEGEIANQESHWENLKQMQLFVIPVTRELLTQPNFAMDAEIPFAMENHIPVLPLMQERGLDALYQEKFGDLQYLDENNGDVTAIRYEDKLANYLTSILIGEEMAEKIRAAFDAYVFLSYRKKDRRYAQELMRLIHKNDFCRDIAIWYDEFLVPGEDFNDAIREALEKCDLFVLAVTPNLVNESNYIMTTEYPMAVQAGKPVLPAELIPTDKEQLAEKFQGIPDSTNAYDRQALAEVLAEMAKSLALQECEDSPEHNFFIGLAYLAGLDVEVDHRRGAELITSAAEAGVEEAIEMLIAMFRTGYGVERSREQGLFWQEKKIGLRQEQYQNEQTVENLDRLFWEFCRCGDYYREEAKLSCAEKKYLVAENCLEASELATDPVIMRDRSAISHRLGDIFYQEGKLAEAKAFMKKGLAITEELAKEISTEDAEQDLSASYLKLGDICCGEGDLQAAVAYYEKCLAIRKAHGTETGTVEKRRDLMITYNRLGAVTQSLGALDVARKYYEECLTIGDVLAKEAGTIRSKRDLSICYNRLADIAQVEGDASAAITYSKKYVDACEEIVRSTDTVEARRDIYVSYQKYGDVLYAVGARDDAKAYYEKGHQICQSLWNEITSLEIYSDLAVSYYRLGLVAPILQRRKYRKQAIAMGEELCRKCPDVALYREYLRLFRNS